MTKLIAVPTSLACLALLAACGGGDREAEAQIGNTEVEVSTTLPENAVTDQQLNAIAEGAAAAASTPQGSATGVVVAPPSNTTTNTTTP